MNANATTNFTASQTLAALNIGDGVDVTLGDGLAFSGPGAGKEISLAAVPEPSSLLALLSGGGMLALTRNHRRRAA